MYKYSIIMAAYNRAEQLKKTLVSLAQYESREDYELMVVIDSKSNDIKEMQEILMSGWSYRVSYNIFNNPGYNSCQLYNHAAKLTDSNYIILQNPENIHVGPILSLFDSVLDQHPHAYVVVACMNGSEVELSWPNVNFIPVQWYQHSVHNPRDLHFCSCIPRRAWDQIGGFDEVYKDGIFYEDNDFIAKIRKANIEIIRCDNLMVLHQDHDKSHWTDPNHQALIEKNRQIYIKKWEQ